MTDEKLLSWRWDARKTPMCRIPAMPSARRCLAEDGRVFAGCNIENAPTAIRFAPSAPRW